MFRDEVGRTWEGPIGFERREIAAHTPKSYGVYQVLAPESHGRQVVYVGIATGATIRERLLEHVSGRGNWALARLGDPSMFGVVWYRCDSLTAREIESHVVTSNRPPFNVRPEYAHYIPSIAIH